MPNESKFLTKERFMWVRRMFNLRKEVKLEKVKHKHINEEYDFMDLVDHLDDEYDEFAEAWTKNDIEHMMEELVDMSNMLDFMFEYLFTQKEAGLKELDENQTRIQKWDGEEKPL